MNGLSSSVFPACAGMFRHRVKRKRPTKSFPRVRGDVPLVLQILRSPQQFSPRARGCSAHWQCQGACLRVFPACAGMFPLPPSRRYRIKCFPRVRGDVPQMIRNVQNAAAFSPRARGCSYEYSQCAIHLLGFPRVRGDVPSLNGAKIRETKFSPRARGCSGEGSRLEV